MKVFQNPNFRNGFTFIEVVVALFMVSGLLNSMLLLQNNIFRSLGSFSSSLQRIYYLKNRLFDAELERAQAKELPPLGKPDKREIESPPTNITYELKKPSSKSGLRDLAGIVIELATANWKEFGVSRQVNLVSFLYYPPKKET